MTNPEQVNRDDAHNAADERIQQLQKQNPDKDLKLESGWWKPGVDLSYDVKEKLDKPTTERMNAILAKIFAEKLEPAAAEEVMQEARECLQGHPELVERFDAIFKSMGPKMWPTVDMMRQQNSCCSNASK